MLGRVLDGSGDGGHQVLADRVDRVGKSLPGFADLFVVAVDKDQGDAAGAGAGADGNADVTTLRGETAEVDDDGIGWIAGDGLQCRRFERIRIDGETGGLELLLQA